MHGVRDSDDDEKRRSKSRVEQDEVSVSGQVGGNKTGADFQDPPPPFLVVAVVGSLS